MHQEGFQELWILGVFRSKSLNLEMQKIWGMDVEMGSSDKVQKFGEKSILIKCSLLYLSDNILFLIFENFYMVFRWA